MPGYGGADQGRRRGTPGGGAGGAESFGALPAEQAPMLTHDGGVYPSPWERFAPYLAEFTGSFLLTMTFIYNYTGERHSPAWTATANGLMVTALVYAFGHVSGANLNPSVTVSLMLIGRYKARVAARLCFAQVLGATFAALVRLWFFAGKVDIGPHEGFRWSGVCAMEFLYSAMIVFVYLNCAASIRNNALGTSNGFVGLAVGFCYLAGGYATRTVSDPVFNTAIAVGLNVAGSGGGGGFNAHMLLYIVADFLGAFLGAGAYRIVRPDEDLELDHQEASGRRRKRLDGDSAKVAAEFFGTFFIILTKAMNRIGDERQDAGVGPEAWSTAAAITAMVYSLRNVSGAHFNPAVSLAAFLSGRTTAAAHVVVFYVVAQFFAAVAAGSLFSVLNHGNPISLKFGSAYPWEAVVFSEAAFCFLITYVLLASTVSESELAGESKKEELAEDKDPSAGLLPNADVCGLAYGACQTAGGFAVGNISGAMLNPAVVFSFCGIDLLKGKFAGDVMAYVFYQVFGALLATGVFMLSHAGLYRSKINVDGEKASV